MKDIVPAFLILGLLFWQLWSFERWTSRSSGPRDLTRQLIWMRRRRVYRLPKPPPKPGPR